MLVEHHIRYKELHGEDKTVWITQSEHKKLHAKLRREQKCKLPSKELHHIASRAWRRTDKAKDKLREINKNFYENHVPAIRFNETISKGVVLEEKIFYNKNNGKVHISVLFWGQHGLKLYNLNSVLGE